MYIYLNILSNCSASDSPSNRGVNLYISPIIHPQAQTSTAVAYGRPNRTSGARYHNVTTLILNK